MPARVTIHDVARVAGVSTTTVSNALSGTGRIATATRARVVAAADELGYTANPAAAGLRRRRVGAIGLAVPSQTFGLEYYMALAMGAATEAVDHGLALTLLPAPAPGGRFPRLHVDGVVVADPATDDPLLARVGDLGLPVVTVERDLAPGARHAGRVEADHAAGLRSLLDHLAGQGAERIALLCPGPQTSFGVDVRHAFEGWSAEHARRALLHEVPLVAEPDQVRDAVRRALADTEPPDAIVAAADGVVATALQEVLRQGLRVPADLLVASYVDGPALQGLSVPVTAVDIAPKETGRQAARLLAGAAGRRDLPRDGRGAAHPAAGPGQHPAVATLTRRVSR